MIYIRELMIFTHATASRSQNVLCRSKNDVFIKQRENAENRKEMRLIEDWGDHQGETVPDETRGAHRSALTSSYSGDDWGPRTAVKVLFRIWLRFQFAGRRSSNETVAEFSCRAVARYQENIYIPIYIYIYIHVLPAGSGSFECGKTRQVKSNYVSDLWFRGYPTVHGRSNPLRKFKSQFKITPQLNRSQVF